MIPEVMYLTNKKRGYISMGFSMGVYCDLMGIFIGSLMGFTGIYIYIYSLVGGKTTPLKNISQLG